MLLLALAYSGQYNVLEGDLLHLMTLLPSDKSRQRVLGVLQQYVPNELLPTLSEIEGGGEKAGSDSSRRLPSGVKILLAILLTGFVAQVVFGSELIASLLAFEPYLILVYEQWWRIATCSLVHAGGLHFASNAIGVVVLGPFLAQYFGNTRFLFFFLFAVVGASLWMLLLMWLSVVEPKPMIGASGGVMGLIGGYLSFYVVSYWRTGSLYHREQLKSVLLIIALQTVFDISTPQVSFLAHFGGLISGIFLFPLFSVSLSHSVAGRRGREE
jgi:rhomboid protease GluP